MSRSGRRQPITRLCVDQPDGIPHLVDHPRAARCDQHREQRRKWGGANSFRRRTSKPLLPWTPDPLEPTRRREALDQFADKNAADILRTARLIKGTLETLKEARAGLPLAHQQHFDVGIARIDALANDLTVTARVMGPGAVADSVSSFGLTRHRDADQTVPAAAPKPFTC